MKKCRFYVFVLLSLIMLNACKQNQNEMGNAISEKTSVANTQDSVRDGVFIHITESYSDPHRVLMPLKMANMMAADKDVLVYMDIHTVELLVKGSKDISFADFESAHTYIKGLVDKKVTVFACPTCLKIAGFKPEDLLEGVQVAQKDKFFNFTKGRIVTLDY
jgi:predicted peroxiredoxin